MVNILPKKDKTDPKFAHFCDKVIDKILLHKVIDQSIDNSVHILKICSI